MVRAEITHIAPRRIGVLALEIAMAGDAAGRIVQHQPGSPDVIQMAARTAHLFEHTRVQVILCQVQGHLFVALRACSVGNGPELALMADRALRAKHTVPSSQGAGAPRAGQGDWERCLPFVQCR